MEVGESRGRRARAQHRGHGWGRAGALSEPRRKWRWRPVALPRSLTVKGERMVTEEVEGLGLMEACVFLLHRET